MKLRKYGLRIENDLDGFKRLRWVVRMCPRATLFYDVRTRRLLVVEGEQFAAGSFVSLGVYTSADFPGLKLQTIYDRLALALEQHWELGYLNG